MPGDWTAQRVEAGIDELRRCIEEVKSLVPGDTYNAPAVHNVNLSIRKTIQKVFGQGSVEYNEYKDYRIDDFPPVYESRTDLVKDKLKRRDFPEKKDKAVAMLEGLISSLEQQPMDLEADQYTGRVFIVHGRDAEAKKQVRTFLEQAKLEPVILDEQANKGQTVIEKFEGNADVDFAVVLLTPDDKGSLADSPGKATKPRPRQNVIFELGFFVGKLGRKRVCVLHKSKVEIMSDYQGVIYVPMDDAGDWESKLAEEIMAAGITEGQF